MSLISFEFLLFAAAVTGIYYLLPRRARAPWLLVCSAVFYAMASFRALFYLGLSIASCWLAGRGMEKAAQKRRKTILIAAICLNLGILLLLKYTPLAGSILSRLSGAELNLPAFLLPLGLSFYTLQAIGYLVDVYRGEIRAEEKLWRFALFMGWFPIIVQGPISRHAQLAGQLCAPHDFSFERICSGAQLMLWGYMKKLIIADRAAMLVNQVYGHYTDYAGLAVAVAALLYTLQLYADFSGCVDICRGCSRLVGVELAENFRRPFFSVSVKELWRRWHMSLSSWFRDYLYIPLGGSRRGKARGLCNTLAVFAVSGLWHGAGLNYLFWGALQGGCIVAETLGAELVRSLRIRLPAFLGAPLRLLRQLYVFLFFSFSFIFFRAGGLRAGLSMVLSIFRGPWDMGLLFSLGLDRADFRLLLIAAALLWLCSLIQEKRGPVSAHIGALPLPLRWLLWLMGLMALLIFGIWGPGYSGAQFIYMGF